MRWLELIPPIQRLNSVFCHSERSRGISLPSRGISRQARNDKFLVISVGEGFKPSRSKMLPYLIGQLVLEAVFIVVKKVQFLGMRNGLTGGVA